MNFAPSRSAHRHPQIGFAELAMADTAIPFRE